MGSGFDALPSAGRRRGRFKVTEDNRARIVELTRLFVAWIKAEMVCLFAWVQWIIIQFARGGHGRLSPAFMVIFLVAVAATALWHLLAMIRAARD
jgi:hypothetical protein